MSRKGFLVKIELSIQKISCPGVCLCSNGKLSLQLHLFDSPVQTKNSRPVFPLCFYEKFVFSKIFNQERRLNELQRRLNREFIYAELIQWRNCDEGWVLATFRTTLDDLLYPATFRGSVMGVNVDLLMEPTDIFPGTIAPKLEVSTKTTVEETILDQYCSNSNVTLITPKALPYKPAEIRGVPKKVCHSQMYSRSQKNHKEGKMKQKKPPFKYSKVPDDLILRTNPNVVVKDYFNERFSEKNICYCAGDKNLAYATEDNYDCRDEIGDHKKYCSTCSSYDNYFSRNASRVHSTSNQYLSSSTKAPTHICSYCARHVLSTNKYHVPSKNGSPCRSDSNSPDSKTKVCFCVPMDKTLAQQLHEKLAKTLDVNNRIFQKCID